MLDRDILSLRRIIVDKDGNPIDFTKLDSTGMATSAKQDQILAAITHANEYGPFSILITRPANHTVYAQDQAIADVDGLLHKVLNVVSVAGKPFKITGIHVQTNDEGFAGTSLLVHIYSDDITPTADKATLAVNPLNASKRAGSCQVVMGTGILKTVGLNDVVNLHVRPVDTGIRCQVTCNQASLTPLLDSSWLLITFMTEPIN